MKFAKILCGVLIHLAASIFLVLGIAGQIKGMKWAPIDAEGHIIQSIDPLIPGAFVGWGAAVILLFWLYVGIQKRRDSGDEIDKNE